MPNPCPQSPHTTATQSAQSAQSAQDKEVVVDTCWLVHACSTIGDKDRPPEGYSQIDNQVRELNISPKELRQEIENLLLNNKLVIAEAVLQELKDFLLDSCDKLNKKNKNRLSHLVQQIKGKVVEIAIGINECKLQKEVFTAIETEANARVHSIEVKTKTNLTNWEELVTSKSKNSISPLIKQEIKEIYRDPVCKTWAKISEFKNAVFNNINKLQNTKNHKPFLLNDFSILLTAKKRKALIKTNDGDIKVLLAAYNQITKERQEPQIT